MPNWGDDILADIQKGVPDAQLLKKYPQLKNDMDVVDEFHMFNDAVTKRKVPLADALEIYPIVKPTLSNTQPKSPYKEIKGSVIPASIDAKFGMQRPVVESTAAVQPQQSVDVFENTVKKEIAQDVGSKAMYGQQVQKGRERVAAEKGVPEAVLPDQTLPQDIYERQQQEASLSETPIETVRQRKIDVKNQQAADELFETPAGKAYYNFIKPVLSGTTKFGANVIGAAIRLNPVNTIFYGKDGKNEIADHFVDMFDPNRAAREDRPDAALYATPEKLQGNLINDGRLNTSKLIPSTVENLTNMALLIFGGQAIGGGKAGLMAMSYLSTEEDYRKEGAAKGLKGGTLDAFANISAGLTSALEAISPNNPMLGKFKQALIKQATKDVLEGVSVNTAVKRVLKELGKENAKEVTQELSQGAGDYVVKEVFDKTMDTPKFNEDYHNIKDEVAETVLQTVMPVTLLMGPGTIKNYRPTAQAKSAWYNTSKNLPAFNALVDKWVAEGKYNPTEAQTMKDNLGMYSTQVQQLENIGFSPDQAATMAFNAYKDKKITQNTSAVKNNPILNQTVGKEIEKDREQLKNEIQDTAMGIPEAGSEITGIELAEIVKNTPNTGKALINKVKDNDYRVEEIDLQEKYDNEPAFRLAVENFEKSKEDEEGLRTPPIVDAQGKVLDGKKRLVQQYVNGERKARVFKQLRIPMLDSTQPRPIQIIEADNRRMDLQGRRAVLTGEGSLVKPELNKKQAKELESINKEIPQLEQQIADFESGAVTYDKRERPKPEGFEGFMQLVSEQVPNVPDNSVIMRMDIEGMDQNARETAVRDIAAGKNTVPARRFKEELQKMYDSGEVHFASGRGVNKQHVYIPIEEFMAPDEVTPEETTFAEENNLADLITESGITAENIDSLKEKLFNGFPYDQSDFDAVKEYLNQEPTSNADGEAVGTQGETQPEDQGDEDADAESDQAVEAFSRELGLDALAMPAAMNPDENISLKDLGIEPQDSILTVIDKLIAHDSEFTPILQFIKAIPGIEKVKFEVYKEGKNKAVDTYFKEKGYNPNKFAGLYFDANRGLFPALAGTLLVNNTQNAYYDITHELLHYVTIDSVMAGKATGLMNSAKYEALKSTYEFIRNEKPIEGGLTSENYGLATFEEFMVESLINPSFRNYVGEVIASGNSDLKKGGKYKGFESFDNFINDVQEFFMDLVRLLIGAETSRSQVNFDESLIENTVRLSTELFFSGANVVNTRFDNVRVRPVSFAAVPRGTLAIPSKVAMNKIEAAVKNAIAAGKTDEEIRAALNKHMPELSEDDIDVLLTKYSKPAAEPLPKSKPKAFENELKDIKKQIRAEFRGFAEGLSEGRKEGKAEAKENATHMADIKKQIQEWVNNALETATKSGVFTGEVKGRLLASMIKRLNNVKSPVGFLAFFDHLEKVLVNVEYDKDVQVGDGIRGKIKSALKNKDKNAETKETVKQFSRLNPSNVSDIKEYNQIAPKVFGVAKGIVAKKDGTVQNESFEISNQEIEAYVLKQEKYAEEKKKERLAEMYDDLVAMGVLDPKTMSLDEMQELIDVIEGNVTDPLLAAAEAWANKEAKMQALRNMLQYQQMALESHVPTDPYTKSEQSIVDNLLALDLDQMDAIQLAKLNDVINNIVVNDNFMGSVEISTLAETQKAFKKQQQVQAESGIKLGKITTSAVKGLATNTLKPEFIFLDTNLTTEMAINSGVDGIFRGYATAKTLLNQAVKKYTKLKESLTKGLDTPVNRYRRGVYAHVKNNFGGTQEEIDAEFERTVRWVTESGKRLSESEDKDERKEGETINHVVEELLVGSKNIADVHAKLQKLAPDNFKLIEFWTDTHQQRKDAVQESAEQVNNQIWEDVENYTATKLKGVNGEFGVTEKDKKDIFDQAFLSKGITSQMAGAKNKRTRSPNLPPNSVLDLDFDAVQSAAFYNTNYDVETAIAITRYKQWLKMPGVNTLYGGAKNKQLLMKQTKNSIALQRGQTQPTEDFERAIKTVANAVQAKGVRIALGSILQLPKQYISVGMSTVVNLWQDADLFIESLMYSNKKAIFDKHLIGLRGETKAGFEKDVSLGTIDRVDFAQSVEKGIHNLVKVGDVFAEKIMWALTTSDVSIARTSWLAYYMQSLRKQGLKAKGLDWQAEADNPNEKAAAYAEQMTTRSQSPSDNTSVPNFYKERNNLKGIMINQVLPFSGFGLNQRMRMTVDAKKILFGGRQAEAWKSLLATLGETVIFNIQKVLIGVYITEFGAKALARLWGFWDDDDEKKEEEKSDITIEMPMGEVTLSKNDKKVIASVFSDFMWGGMGNATQYQANQVANWFYKSLVTESYPKMKVINPKDRENPYPSLYFTKFDNPDRIDLSGWGTYGVAPEKIYNTYKAADLIANDRIKYTKGGVDKVRQGKVKELTDGEKNLYTFAFMVDALSVIGISEGALSEVNRELQTIAAKKMNFRYGGEKLMKVTTPAKATGKEE